MPEPLCHGWSWRSIACCRHVSQVDIECLEALEDVSTIVVHPSNVSAWRTAISRYASPRLKATGLQVVGASHALEAIEHAKTGHGPNGMIMAWPALTRM